MNLNFDFLRNVELVAPEKAKPTRVNSIKNPEGMRIRVFGNGKIYPSKELVEKFNLEYVSKTSETEANGLDIFSSKNWGMFPQTTDSHVIFVIVVPKSSPKVDLFGQVSYDEDGNPKRSVLEQGGGSFGKELLPMIEDVYGISIDKKEYRDFEIKEDIVIESPTGVYFVPKTITRGERKGEISVVRRENVTVMPLAPVVDEAPNSEDVEEIGDNYNAEAYLEHDSAPYPEYDGPQAGYAPGNSDTSEEDDGSKLDYDPDNSGTPEDDETQPGSDHDISDAPVWQN